MHSLRNWLIAGAAAISLATAAQGQFGGMRGGPPSLQGVFRPVVGHGAAYEIQHQGGEKTNMEIAVVGKDTAGGADAYWLEFTIDTPQGQMVMKTLSSVQTNNVVNTRMIMQMPGKPPMEFPEQFLHSRSQPHPSDIANGAVLVGSESVTVPAGAFTCDHYHFKDGTGDAWVTKDVSPWGLVKSQSSADTIVLVKAISDAKDKITQTPVPFNPMLFGAGQQQ